MNPSALFIKRPVATILLTIGIALTGIAAYFALPVASLPSVDFPVVFCQANLPGASPTVMASSVATPLERRLGQIADVNEITSTSQVGRTQVIVQFGLSRNIDGAYRDAQAAVQAARADLPATLRSNPSCNKANPSNAPIMILNLTSDVLTPSQVYDAASLILQQRLSQIQGVGQADVQGGGAPAVRVEVNPLTLAKYGIALEDVRAAINAANANQPKGMYSAHGQRLQIYVNDQTFKASDYQGLIIAVRNGNPVRLSDVAVVRDGGENERFVGLFNGKPAIVVRIQSSPNANIVATVDRIKAILPQLRQQLTEVSPHIDLNISTDRTTTIRGAIRDVERTLLISIVLVVIVVLLFLRNGRATLIPGVAVVVSLLGTLGLMFLLKFSLDNLSLMALTVATGFVVDDAIVVLENITRHVEEGMPRFQAALKGAGEVGFTVVSMSISLIAVFIPILMMGGIVGKLFREFAMTLSAAILISLVVSLTATPMMAAYLVDERVTGDPADAPRKRGVKGFFSWCAGKLERGFNWMAETYEGSLIWALDHKRIVLFSLFATIVFNVYLYIIVPKGFFPQQDTGQLQGGVQVDQASSFLSTRAKFYKLVDIVKSDPAISTVTAFSGGAGGFMFVELKPRSERPGETSDQVIARIRPKTFGVSGAQLFLQSSQDFRFGGRQSAAQYQYTLQSDDIDQLHTWAEKLTAQLKKKPELQDVNSDQAEHGLETFITIDRDKASRLGLTASAVDNVLNDAFAQRAVATIYNALNQYRVILTVQPQFAQNPSALDNLYVSPGQGVIYSSAATAVGSAASAERTSAGVAAANLAARQGSNRPAGLVAVAGGAGANSDTPIVSSPAGPRQQSAGVAVINNAATQQITGAGQARSTTGNANQLQTGSAVSTATSRMIPLSAFATYAPSSTAVSVNHQSQAVATTISFNLGEGQSLSAVKEIIAQAEEEISMPNTVRGSFAGTAQQFADTTNNQPLLILTALLAVYIVLGVLYESYIHPITVLSTLPSAGVGALLALMFFHVDFDIIALIGVILLIGIVKKNAILIIDFALTAERDQGLNAYDAIYQASVLRFRPILMTTMAAILGALPLAFGFGEGGEIRRPLGIAIVGGLIASQVLTLLTTPVVYLYMDKLRRRGPRRGDKAYPLPEGGPGTVGSPDPAFVPRGTGEPTPASA